MCATFFNLDSNFNKSNISKKNVKEITESKSELFFAEEDD